MRHSTKDNYLYLTTTPVPRLIVSLAVPTIISMLVTSFYNMADTYFVGKINTQSTAAVGIVFSVMSIIQAVGFFFGHGSGNYISRKLGAQETGNAEKMAATGFFWALFMGIFLAVVGLIFLSPLSLALGNSLDNSISLGSLSPGKYFFSTTIIERSISAISSDNLFFLSISFLDSLDYLKFYHKNNNYSMPFCPYILF